MLQPVEPLNFFEKYCDEYSHSNSLFIFATFVEQHINIAQLQVSLLKKNDEKKNKDLISWIFYKILSIFGGIYAFFSGFDGMIAVLTVLFPMLNLKLILLLGLMSALSSLGVFLARDKLAIAESFNISEVIEGSFLDNYLFLLENYYHDMYQASMACVNDLKIIEYLPYIRILKCLFEEKSKRNDLKIHSYMSQLQTQTIIIIGAILFFSDGFFIGQGLALFLVQAFTLNASILVLCLSIFVGLIASSGYWFVERPYVEKYLYQKLMTDEEHVQKSLLKLDDMLKILEKLAYVMDGHPPSQDQFFHFGFCSAATAGKVSPSR